MDQLLATFGVTPANGKIANKAEENFSNPPATSSSVEQNSFSLSEAIPTTPMSEFANRVMSAFRVNWEHRSASGTTDRLNYCMRTHRKRFSDEQMNKLREQFPGSDIPDRIFSPVTSVKNRSLRSILVELVNQVGDPLFKVESSPLPDDGGDALTKAVKITMVEIEGLLQGLEAQGVRDDNVPPEVVARLSELVQNTFERRYDDMKNAAESELRDRAKRMEKKVWDIFEEGGWNKAFVEAIDDFCVFGTAVILGPVMRNVAVNEVKTDKNGAKSYRRAVKCIPSFERVNPFDCYPAPDAVEVDDGPLCITVRFTGEELYRLASSVEGTDTSSGGWMGVIVNDILSRHPYGGVKLNAFAFDPVRRTCEANGFDDSSDCTFEGVRCFMPMRGSELIDMGVVKNLDGSEIKPSKWYRTESVVIENRVVYICIHADELGVPVSKACCYNMPGSWWGEAIADMVAQCQCVLNNTARNMLLNQSMTSAPSGYVNDVSRLDDKSPDALKWRAGKLFKFTNGGSFGPGGNSGPPMGVFTIPSTLGDLLSIWKAMQQQADLDSGLPSYSEGQSAGASGALRTAQGLNTFVENMMRGGKSIMTNLDKGIISKCARMTADWVLIYDKDQSLKGDVYIRSVGLIGRVQKTQREGMRLQILNMCLNSQILVQAIGVKGVLELFRPSLDGLDLNPDDIMPSKAKIKEQDEIMQIAQIIKATGGAGTGGGAAPEQGSGMQSGVAPVDSPAPAVEGQVAERRGAA